MPETLQLRSSYNTDNFQHTLQTHTAPISYLVHAWWQQLDDCELPSTALQLLPGGPVVKGALYLHMLPTMTPCVVKWNVGGNKRLRG